MWRRQYKVNSYNNFVNERNAGFRYIRAWRYYFSVGT
jgi:hypothetical protein